MLAAINAHYAHVAFGLRRLQAHLGCYQENTQLLEFTLQQSAHEIAEAILARKPRLVGLSLYIWNIEIATAVAAVIRAVSPETVLVCGGPEMTGDPARSPVAPFADYIIRGEGEEAFLTLVHTLLQGHVPPDKIIDASPPDLSLLADPYPLYTEQDIAHRVIYVEASRGCPRRCAFCLSGAFPCLRYFPLHAFLHSMSRLLDRGARRFKFIDRTFNVDLNRMHTILRFFRERPEIEQLHLHFEIMPDHLPPDTLALLASFPHDALHLETGVQSVNPDIQKAIRRYQRIEPSLENLHWLRTHTGCQLHADLIFGLPGESIDSFAEGFNRLVALDVQELQLGLLKNLPGTPLGALSSPDTVYDTNPPYELLQNEHYSFDALQRMKRFAKYFDLLHNHGNFPESLALLRQLPPSPFHVFEALTEQIWEQEGKTYGIPLVKMAEHLHIFLCACLPDRKSTVSAVIEKDFRRFKGRRDRLPFLTGNSA